MAVVWSFSLGRDFKVYFGEIETVLKVEMSEREKKSRGFGDTGRRIKDEVSPCKGSTMISELWKQKNGEGKAESKHRGG